MPRPRKPARLQLRPAGNGEPEQWIIRDGQSYIRTKCSEANREAAERRLAEYVAEKYQPERTERNISKIPIADVINLYLTDVVPGLANPEKSIERSIRLIEFFGDKFLEEINGPLCRAYVTSRGSSGGAKRDLEDLRAAVNHHHKEGYHREAIRIVLPERGKARQRWLTRSEVARLLWACLKTREIQEGEQTKRKPLRHLCRFLLLGIYTGSRPGAVMTAAWDRGPGRSFIDIQEGVFYRHAEGIRETDKRQPPVKLSPRLLAHLKRWKRLDGERGYVVSFTGEPVKSLKTALGRAVRLAKLEAGVTAYSLRHTAATWLVSKGINTRKVADYLGTSEEMIRRHYGHLSPDYQDEAALEIGRK